MQQQLTCPLAVRACYAVTTFRWVIGVEMIFRGGVAANTAVHAYSKDSAVERRVCSVGTGT